MRFKYLAFILVFFSSKFSFSQKEEYKSSYLCSEAIRTFSKEWKSDSLANKGYRYEVFREIRYSKIDNISKHFLLSNLGNPSQIQKFYSGVTKKNYVSYIYFVYTINDFPENKPFEGLYINFIFDEGEIKLESIEDGDYCG